jgi:hypothetical protein
VRNIMRAPRLAQLTDSQRENAIRTAHRALVGSQDKSSKAAAWRVLCRLIKSRSPEAIARLEEERGLARPS